MRVPFVCLVLAACGSDATTGPDARPAATPDAALPPDATLPSLDAAPAEPDAAPPAAPQRTVTSVAGYGRHDGPIDTAWIGRPWGLAFLGNGDLIIFDGAYNTIRRLDTHGVLTTEVGTGSAGYGGDNGP